MENVYKSPKVQQFHLEGVPHIGVYDAFSAMLEGEVYLLDVREPEERHHGMFGESENILYHPMSRIIDTFYGIPKDKPVVVCCESGVRSMKVANLLLKQGFPHVANLDGGFMEWQQQGMPVVGGNSHSCHHCSGGCGGC
ncbi:MAG: hypothetical protein CSA95_03100 [Bacteroidetes bacterium]|nr:MAG: hypothetical protein CSA95_03100 [Bacteroidota bacterium]